MMLEAVAATNDGSSYNYNYIDNNNCHRPDTGDSLGSQIVHKVLRTELDALMPVQIVSLSDSLNKYNNSSSNTSPLVQKLQSNVSLLGPINGNTLDETLSLDEEVDEVGEEEITAFTSLDDSNDSLNLTLRDSFGSSSMGHTTVCENSMSMSFSIDEDLNNTCGQDFTIDSLVDGNGSGGPSRRTSFKKKPRVIACIEEQEYYQTQTQTPKHELKSLKSILSKGRHVNKDKDKDKDNGNSSSSSSSSSKDNGSPYTLPNIDYAIINKDGSRCVHAS